MSRRGLLAVGILGIAALGSCRAVPRLVWNASASVPIGLYRVQPARPIVRGDLVLATLPDDARALAAERGYLPANVPLVKRVTAMEGDTVCGIGMDITIDERIVAKRLPTDGRGRILPGWQGCHSLASDELFLLMEGVPDSFDGRYFGPVETSRIVGRLVPLWIR